jgi:uncharacterized membrane protein YccC
VALHLGRLFITPTALTISAAGGTDVSLALGTERLVDTLLAAAIAMALLWTSEWG